MFTLSNLLDYKFIEGRCYTLFQYKNLFSEFNHLDPNLHCSLDQISFIFSSFNFKLMSHPKLSSDLFLCPFESPRKKGTMERML